MGEAKGKGKNPFDPSGRQMEFYRCGSKDHLSSSCHLPIGKGGKGSRKGGGFFEDSSEWQPGAVEGACYDYTGFTTDASRSFLAVSEDELRDQDGEAIPEEYAEPHRDRSIYSDYECSWTSEPLGARDAQAVMHHRPVDQPQSSSQVQEEVRDPAVMYH